MTIYLWIMAFMLGLAVTAEAALKLDWLDNSINEQNFIIERKAEPCASNVLPFAVIATVGANVKTFTDAATVEGGDYCYRIAASNTAGKSAYSNSAGGAAPFTIPAAPSGLGVTILP